MPDTRSRSKWGASPLEETVMLGDLIRKQKSGLRTQSLWQGRSNFLQTAGNEDRGTIHPTTVPRGTGRGPAAAQIAGRVMKDYVKNRMGIPDINLADWGGEGGYKFRDVVGAVKHRNDYSQVAFGTGQPVPTTNFGSINQNMGGFVTPTAAGPSPSTSPIGPMASAAAGAAMNMAKNPTVQAAARGAVKGAVKGSWAGPMGMVAGAARGAAKGARQSPDFNIKTPVGMENVRGGGAPAGPTDDWRPPF